MVACQGDIRTQFDHVFIINAGCVNIFNHIGKMSISRDVSAIACGTASASIQTTMPSAFQIFLFTALRLSFGSLFSYIQPTK